MGIGAYRHRVTVEHPTTTPTADGGFTDAFAPGDPPAWDCSITPASPRDLERFLGGTVTAQATHVLRGRYHAGLTTQARIVFGARVLNVVAVVDRDARQIETELLVAEVVA
jgi:head-tail adaptor